MREIKLSFCNKVTDAGVVALAEHCKELREINLWGCDQVTDAGVRAFKERLPECVSDMWGLCIARSRDN